MLNEFSAHLEDDQWRKLAVTSLEPHAGRSLVAANIARALALKEQPVLLVDADLRTKTGRRSPELMGLSDEGAGLWELLLSSGDVSDLTTLVEVTGVDVLRSGDLPPRREDGTEPALDALGSRRLKKVVDNLKQPNRHLLVELPPLDAQETVLEAAAAIGNLLLVVRSGQTARAELREMVQTLQNRDVPIRAVILTDVPDELLSGKPLYETPGPPTGRRWGGLRKQTPNESIHGTPV
jgi:Mrp family chromosome partitioning ATPase